MATSEERKAALTKRLAELTHRVSRIENDLGQPVSEDLEEQATEREDDEMLEDLGAAGAREIRMIEAALDRIESGSYGICARCGDPISEERLDVLPQTPLCRDCAAGR
jgi:RNA polymerase-binding transcription factor DksA